MGLFALVVLTTSAVAWVSLWWVPAYLALMVVIFVTPQRGHRSASVVEQGEESIDGVVTQLGDGVRVDRADEQDHHHLASESISDRVVGESTSESAGFNPVPVSAGTTKPRRGRGRGRKAAKAATEQAPASASVIWIRVGPGKFVRADANTTANDQAQTEDVDAGANPATDAPAEMPTAPSALAEAKTEEHLPDPPEASPGDEGIFVASTDRVLESAEEYGIAPSAFGPSQLDTYSVEGLAHGVSEVTVTHEADSILLANLGVNASGHGEDGRRFGSQEGTSASRVGRVSRGIANAIPGGDRPYLRRKVPKGPKPRTSVWSSDRSNARLRQAACRAYGRISHVQRALRPRSPPCR